MPADPDPARPDTAAGLTSLFRVLGGLWLLFVLGMAARVGCRDQGAVGPAGNSGGPTTGTAPARKPAVLLDPEAVAGLRVRAFAPYTGNDPPPPLAACDAALRADPNDRAARLARVRLFLAAGDDDPPPADADADADALARLEPKAAVGPIACGLCHLRAGRPDLAVADLDEAVRRDPRSPWPLVQRALTHADLDDTERAVADLSRAIDLDPGCAPAYFARWLIYAELALVYRQALIDTARVDLDKALELDPTLERLVPGGP